MKVLKITKRKKLLLVAVALLASTIQAKNLEKSTAEPAQLVKSGLVNNLESGKKQVIVAYGTSLTANGAWVDQLRKVLEDEFPGLSVVINSGGSGKWSQWGVNNLDERVIMKKPDTLFMEFSINDSVARFNASVDIARANLESMIDSVLKANPSCEIILMTMTPGDLYPKGHRSRRENIEAHYQMYRSVAKERGLSLIDHYLNWKALQSSNPTLFKQYVPDTIHPTATGCSKVRPSQFVCLKKKRGSIL